MEGGVGEGRKMSADQRWKVNHLDSKSHATSSPFRLHVAGRATKVGKANDIGEEASKVKQLECIVYGNI